MPKAYLDWIVRVETPLEESLERFEAAEREADVPALEERAQEILVRARSAREAIEKTTVLRRLTSAHGEELIFLNHVVLGFQRYLDSGGGLARLEELESILRRARAHQKGGRGPPNTA